MDSQIVPLGVLFRYPFFLSASLCHISFSLHSAENILKKCGPATFFEDRQVTKVACPWAESFFNKFHMLS